MSGAVPVLSRIFKIESLSRDANLFNTMHSASSNPAGLKDRVVLITGGTGALGSAVTQTLLQAGARVATTYIIDAEFTRLQESVAADSRGADDAPVGDALTGHKVDLTNEDAVAALIDTIVSKHGRLDGVVNIAGGFVFAPLVETTSAQFDLMWNLNFRSLFLTSRAAYPHLKAGGGGTIVSIGARPGLQGSAGLGAYAASKAAVINFTQTLADEGRADGIRAFSILPSIIDTPANRAAMPDADFAAWVTPESLARVIRFVLEDESRDLSGATLPVYGRA